MLPKNYKEGIKRAYGRVFAEDKSKQGASIEKIEKAKVQGEKRGKLVAKMYPLLAIFSLIITILVTNLFLGTRILFSISLGILAFLASLSPLVLKLRRDKNRKEELESQMVEILTRIASDIAGGSMSLPESIRRTIDESDEPIKTELEYVYNEMETAGSSFGKAIKIISHHSDSNIASRVCNTLSVAHSKIPEKDMHIALYKTANMIREDEALKDKKQLAFAQPIFNFSILIIVFLPVITLLVSGIISNIVPSISEFMSQGGTDVTGKVNEVLYLLPQFLFFQGTAATFSVGLLIKKDPMWIFKMYAILNIMILLIHFFAF